MGKAHFSLISIYHDSICIWIFDTACNIFHMKNEKKKLYNINNICDEHLDFRIHSCFLSWINRFFLSNICCSHKQKHTIITIYKVKVMNKKKNQNKEKKTFFNILDSMMKQFKMMMMMLRILLNLFRMTLLFFVFKFSSFFSITMKFLNSFYRLWEKNFHFRFVRLFSSLPPDICINGNGFAFVFVICFVLCLCECVRQYTVSCCWKWKFSF